MMQVDVYTEFNKELMSYWTYFESECHSFPFQSFEWQRYWYEKVGEPKYNFSLCIIVCRVDNRVRAIFPFGIRTSFCARVLEFLGSGEADYSAPLIATNMSSIEFRDIWSVLIKYIPPHDIVHFRNLTKFIHIGENFLLNNISVKEIGKAYSVILPNTFEDYSKKLSKSMLKDNRRMTRRIKEKGDLKFVILEKEYEFNEVLNTMVSQKEARYTNSGARNIFLDNSVRNFYKQIYLLSKRGLDIHLSALMIDHEILATHLGIHYKNQFYYLMPTFNHDEKWEKFSLGRLHLERLFHWATENDVKKFDFTIGAESYKKTWCNEEMLIFRHLKLISLRGLICYIYCILYEYIRSRKTLRKFALKFIK